MDTRIQKLDAFGTRKNYVIKQINRNFNKFNIVNYFKKR